MSGQEGKHFLIQLILEAFIPMEGFFLPKTWGKLYTRR